MKDKNSLLTLTPMEKYEAPQLPTYAGDLPNFERKIPRRWKNKAVIATAVGILGATALTGCSVIENLRSNDNFYCSDLHHGGAGGAPIYVVSITEQEALEMIRYQLANVGVNLVEPSFPKTAMIDDVYIEIGDHGEVYDVRPMFSNEIGMQLVDEENSIGIVLRGWWRHLESSCTIGVHERVEQRFLREHDLSSVGVFFRTSHGTRFDADEIWNLDDDELYELENYDESFIRARSQAERDLNRQIQDFIVQLRTEGIIE